MENYVILDERIGEGTFGTVMKGKHLKTEEIVALKQIRIKHSELKQGELPKAALNEARTLEHVKGHPNILGIHDIFAYGSAMIVALDFAKTDLAKVMKECKRPLSESTIKCFLRQILRGIAHCHKHNVMHRDIKPANILVSPTGQLKIGDFGLATVYMGPQQTYSHCVATRWYRAPELLYGSITYDPKVDIYAIGCIFVEMLNGCPLFPGDSDIDQLRRVITAFGVQNEESWPGVSKLPDYDKILFDRNTKPMSWSELVPNASPQARDLLSHLCVCDPAKRYSAKEALLHPYFYSEPLPIHYTQIPYQQLAPRAWGNDTTLCDDDEIKPKREPLESILAQPFQWPAL
mmetsp:Transcript_3726/g.5509  ORF Transcript_3726/g.5509 Transcript_3726/m.5509 type:complete len:347 (+) Transcript_3726:38-1078(+)